MHRRNVWVLADIRPRWLMFIMYKFYSVPTIKPPRNPKSLFEHAGRIKQCRQPNYIKASTDINSIHAMRGAGLNRLHFPHLQGGCVLPEKEVSLVLEGLCSCQEGSSGGCCNDSPSHTGPQGLVCSKGTRGNHSMRRHL